MIEQARSSVLMGQPEDALEVYTTRITTSLKVKLKKRHTTIDQPFNIHYKQVYTKRLDQKKLLLNFEPNLLA